MGSRAMTWLVVLGLVATGVGCSGTHEELVEGPPSQPSAGSITEVESLASPIIELTQEMAQQAEDRVRAAKRMLNEDDLETAAILLKEALALDPTSRSAQSLQQRLERAQRDAAEQARRTLIGLYQREGLAILQAGDTDRALGYLQAAARLEPADRKIFALIQRAYETLHRLQAKSREQAFNARLRQAKSGVSEDVSPEDVSPELVESASMALIEPKPSASLAQPPQLPVPIQALVGPSQQPVEALSPEPAAAPLAPPVAASTESIPTVGVVPMGPAQPGEYTVQPEDVLKITVFEEPELSTTVRVTSMGEVIFPLLGRVPTAGLTVTQVQEKLTTLLAADYLVNPQVQVFLDTTANPRKVFITGAVNRPGSYTISAERQTTIMEAIAMAGGFSDEAAVNKTRIVRIENGIEKAVYVRITDIVKKGDKTQDVAVRPNDIIFVPESFF